MDPIRVTVWNEYRHEKTEEAVAKVYPEGIHNCIAAFLRDAGFAVKTATLDEPEHGLTQEVLDNTDVLFWWGHMAHGEVKDEIVERVYRRVMDGMGMVVLHSGHASKIMQKLMGTNSGELKWREIGEKEILWAVSPSHPILRGLPEKIGFEAIIEPVRELFKDEVRAVGTALGLLLGMGLHQFVIRTAEVDMVMFGRAVYWPSYVYSAVLTILFGMLVNLVMHRKLRSISMVESMKAPE